MPRLMPHRQEIFVQTMLAKKGMTQRRAYVEAGYKSKGDAIDQNASRLTNSDTVKARMDELLAPLVRKTRRSAESIADQLDQAFDGALAAAQFGSATAAAAAKAKLLGFMRDKIEIGGVGEFDGLDTPEKVIERTREELGDEAAYALAAMVGRAPSLTAADRVNALMADASDPRDVLALLDEMRAIAEAHVLSVACDVTPEF